MAEIAVVKPGLGLGHHGRVWKWPAVGQGDTCQPINIQGTKDVTIFAEGNFDGGTVGLLASPMIDTTPALAVYAACTDLAGNTIALAADGHAAVAELGVYYKPGPPSGGASTALDIYLEARD